MQNEKLGDDLLRKESNPFLKLTSGFARTLLRIYVRVCFRPKIYYEDKSVKKKIKTTPVIFIPNHSSYKDGPTLFFMFRNCSLLVAKEWHEKKLINWLMYSKPTIPLDRYGVDTGWLKEAVKMIKNGKHVVIFPEGHTTSGEKIDDFKAGFAMLSVMTGAPVLPVYINGEYNVLHGRRLKIYVGKPEELEKEGRGLKSEYLLKQCKKYKDTVSEMERKYKDL